MATKRKPSAKSKRPASSAKSTKTTETKVTRITASDDVAPLEKVKAKNPAKADADTKDMPKTKAKSSRRTPWRATGEYFAGAWYEIRQVRWPTRVATLKMTFALILFTGFFVVIILLLDWGFQSLFNALLG